ncbi:glycosyltransferase [Acidocella sp. MX-AZ03]|uniref:glycosyltransferase n=1 Tax=Acidocella sp. MX-AZ03 TaxID=2697363 RepID=UPI0022DD8FE8|nr:glycosyltransferase [Acidocella sp. MX-AZ03]WBO60417.1 glycosyltransferase [Acidocella sp. MX-AZ03]
MDVLIRPNTKVFGEIAHGARFIELPYLTGDVFRQLRDGVTAVIDPFGALPCEGFPNDIALSVVIHDLMHLEAPGYFTAAERHGRSASFAQGLSRADSIITFTADQARAIRKFYPGTTPTVIPHLPYMCMAREPASIQLPMDLDHFLLFPAVKWPHKNHKTVLEAFTAYIARTGSPLKLVMCGGPCAESRFSFLPAPDLLSSQIVDLGRVSDELLRSLYSAASAVLFPTHYEGFGIPVLEAAYLGKMVLASRLAVFDEILGPDNYLAVEDPLCHQRWIEAFNSVEDNTRAVFEQRVLSVKQNVSLENFRNAFLQELQEVGSRYMHPSGYFSRRFPIGDRVTTSRAIKLDFADLYDTAHSERGTRSPILASKSVAAQSFIFRSKSSNHSQCLRATYNASAHLQVGAGAEFFVWARLLSHDGIENLRYSVNDQNVIELLPLLADGDWHLIREPLPSEGYIDFRAGKEGHSESPGFELELFDASLLIGSQLAIPEEAGIPHGLTVVVPAEDQSSLDAAITNWCILIETLGAVSKSLNLIIVSTLELTAPVLPQDVRIFYSPKQKLVRKDAAATIGPYEAISQLLLLEACDLPSLSTDPNLRVIKATLSSLRSNASNSLIFLTQETAFWHNFERGRIIATGDRVGQPVPLLDEELLASLLSAPTNEKKPRFAIIETDRTSPLSHHGIVTNLFISGAVALGFEPVLGLCLNATSEAESDIKVWSGFSPQVYFVGSADTYAVELSTFIEAQKLTSDDVVFMHSLSPQILLGTARYIAANPHDAPRFIMRFFSTAEAMGGHRLSYVKILRSILAVSFLRNRMSFFTESRNLLSYYLKETGGEFPLLFNPLHPSLAMVRSSSWIDTNLAKDGKPILAYFGEAREEKGFDELPAILSGLLASPIMAEFQFLIQTGSNHQNDTPTIIAAKAALSALRIKYPGRIKTFESAETAEQFYFMMKHAKGIIAPYRVESYAKRGTGVTLEAIQMGLDVFALSQTDLYATFGETGQVIPVPDASSFSKVIIEYYETGVREQRKLNKSYELTPRETVERLLELSRAFPVQSDGTILWVGNDTFGEGCSAVYAAQKRALRELNLDCLELFVPWPDLNWSGVDASAYDERIYGFSSEYQATGFAWVARPSFGPSLTAVVNDVNSEGPTFDRLRNINSHMQFPQSLRAALTGNCVERTLLNYAHLYPVIAGVMPIENIVCETHDILAYQHAVRRGDAISLSEKLDEFKALAQFPHLIAISAAEQRELSKACITSTVHWRLPPFTSESSEKSTLSQYWQTANHLLTEQGDIPDQVTQPSPAMLRLYFVRPDLRQVFNLSFSADRLAFFQWFVVNSTSFSSEATRFTPAQLAWLTTTASSTLSGAARLVLVHRPDVRAAFSSVEGIDAESLERWLETHGTMNLALGPQIYAGVWLNLRQMGLLSLQCSYPRYLIPAQHFLMLPTPDKSLFTND